MFEGFALERIDVGEAVLRVRHGGSGPPVVLLHGHPRTHVTWHRVAPPLAQRHTVVCPDLRGYGESSKPPTTSDHEPYSKRAMARDCVALMRAGLGIDREHDDADRAAGRRVRCPTLVAWSLHDDLEELWGDPLAIWRDWADDVRGATIDSGHHMAEEAPDQLAAVLLDFLSARASCAGSAATPAP